MGTVSERISIVRKAMADAAAKCGRNPEAVKLILVTKQVSVDRIVEAYESGHLDFGENRVQELVEKSRQLPPDIRWHMIGHLQTNKVKQTLNVAKYIHSLDRLELAESIARAAEKQGINKVRALIQCNISGESSKSGISEENLDALMEGCAKLKCFQLSGLMTIAPLTNDREKIRAVFKRAKFIFEGLKKKYPQYGWTDLSMGMSQDYLAAIEEGSTMVRIGSAVFGSRGAGKPENWDETA